MLAGSLWSCGRPLPALLRLPLDERLHEAPLLLREMPNFGITAPAPAGVTQPRYRSQSPSEGRVKNRLSACAPAEGVGQRAPQPFVSELRIIRWFWDLELRRKDGGPHPNSKVDDHLVRHRGGSNGRGTVLIWVFILVFLRQVLLGGPEWLPTLGDSPASALQGLGVKARATTLGKEVHSGLSISPAGAWVPIP